MFQLPERIREQLAEWLAFVKWLLRSCLTGIIVGLVVTALSMGVDVVTRLRGEYPNIIGCCL